MSAKRYRVIGLMSGTSLDGVDAAVIETDGERIFAFGPAVTVPLTGNTDFKAVMAAAVNWGFGGPQPDIFARASDDIHASHIRAIDALGVDMAGIDLIGFHGQTVLHHPVVGGTKGQTLQLGDGAVLARHFGVPCAFDFRSADVAAGGQGAPLAPIYHKALCDYAGLSGRIAVVNIGGVSNVTLIDGDKPLIATDCGPGNGPLVPRSADRYDFDVVADLTGHSPEDGAATLCSFTAQAVASDLKNFDPQTIIVCGGGRLNPAIMGMLDIHAGGDVVSAEHIGWNGDASEAQAFGYLAVRTLRGLPISFPGTTGAPRALTGGKIAQALQL